MSIDSTLNPELVEALGALFSKLDHSGGGFISLDELKDHWTNNTNTTLKLNQSKVLESVEKFAVNNRLSYERLCCGIKLSLIDDFSTSETPQLTKSDDDDDKHAAINKSNSSRKDKSCPHSANAKKSSTFQKGSNNFNAAEKDIMKIDLPLQSNSSGELNDVDSTHRNCKDKDKSPIDSDLYSVASKYDIKFTPRTSSLAYNDNNQKVDQLSSGYSSQSKSGRDLVSGGSSNSHLIDSPMMSSTKLSFTQNQTTTYTLEELHTHNSSGGSHSKAPSVTCLLDSKNHDSESKTSSKSQQNFSLKAPPQKSNATFSDSDNKQSPSSFNEPNSYYSTSKDKNSNTNAKYFDFIAKTPQKLDFRFNSTTSETEVMPSLNSQKLDSFTNTAPTSFSTYTKIGAQISTKSALDESSDKIGQTEKPYSFNDHSSKSKFSVEYEDLKLSKTHKSTEKPPNEVSLYSVNDKSLLTQSFLDNFGYHPPRELSPIQVQISPYHLPSTLFSIENSSKAPVANSATASKSSLKDQSKSGLDNLYFDDTPELQCKNVSDKSGEFQSHPDQYEKTVHNNFERTTNGYQYSSDIPNVEGIFRAKNVQSSSLKATNSGGDTINYI